MTETPFWAAHAEPVTPTVSAETDRQAWLAARRHGIGSSDASAVVGLSRYSSPWQLWLDKTGRTPLDGSRAWSARQQEMLLWGNLLEPVIVAQIAERLGVTVTKPTMLRSRAHPWMLCDPDGIIDDGAMVVECKNTSAWMSRDWNPDEGLIPDHAELQSQHAMAVTGADRAVVAGLIGGNELRIVVIERDQRLIDDVLLPAEELFWHHHVLGDVEPPIDGSDDTRDAILAAATPRPDPIHADDEAAVRDLIHEYQDAALNEKHAKAVKARVRNELLHMLGGAPALLDHLGNELVRVKRGVFAKSRFEQAYPEIADITRRKIDVLDVAAVKREHPDEYRQHQATLIHIPTR